MSGNLDRNCFPPPADNRAGGLNLREDPYGEPSGLNPVSFFIEPQQGVGWIIRHKDALAGFIMGNHGVRTRHDAATHGDRALVHRPPAPRGDHVPIDRDDLPHLHRYQRQQQGLVGPWEQTLGFERRCNKGNMLFGGQR